jgi:hypothetical protein
MPVVTDADGYTVTREGKARPKVTCDGKTERAGRRHHHHLQQSWHRP